jgi:hypothetical protein
MNRLKIILMAGLAALDLVAVLFAWRSFSGADATDRLPVRSASTIVPAALSDASAATEGNDPETLARPLFAKSRRPWQGGPRLANEASPAPPQKANGLASAKNSRTGPSIRSPPRKSPCVRTLVFFASGSITMARLRLLGPYPRLRRRRKPRPETMRRLRKPWFQTPFRR